GRGTPRRRGLRSALRPPRPTDPELHERGARERPQHALAGAARAPAGAGLRAACAALPRGPGTRPWGGVATGRIASVHPGSPRINRNFWDGSLTDSEHEYGADEITVLEGLEAVRKRPGMYIGATSQRGLHHLVYEVLDNSVDEALAGRADQITTTLLPDGSISVSDNGAGIPTEWKDEYNMSTVTVVLTMLHAGGKFGGGGYKVSGGLHGVGVSVVNALSEWLSGEVRRDGFTWTQSFARGEPTTELLKGEPTTEHGTTVTFKPDADIFETTEVDFEVIETREREMAFLTRGLRLTLIDLRTEDRVVEFYAENGLADYVRHINKNRTPTHKTQIAFERETEEGAVEVAMQWNDSYQASVH